MEKKHELEEVLVTFMKTESFEVVFQGIIAVCLVSMSHYKISLTTEGLQTFFVELDQPNLFSIRKCQREQV